MKFIHLSDLHLGKTIHEYSMTEDQEYIMRKILNIIDEEQPQGIFICGDIFDRTIASTEALRLFDNFLVDLVQREISVYIISGNHDSPERLSFGSRLIALSGVHISPAYDGRIAKHSVNDEHGDIDIYLMPFLKPIFVRRHFPEEEISTWSDALNLVIKSMSVNTERRNILLAHQFVTGAFRSESEEINVGGADNVDIGVFEAFDYVALGHLHGPQSMENGKIRYCGTPLKYSFSEANQNKSITVIEFGEKGHVDTKEIPLVPMRDMIEIRGKYLDITARDFYQGLDRNNYYRITLTDEEDQPDAIGKLRVIYPNLMRLDYDNKRTRAGSKSIDNVDANLLTPMELFEILYMKQNHREMSHIQKGYLGGIIDKVWEGIR